MSAVAVSTVVSSQKIDEVVRRTKDASRDFARLAIGERIALLEKIRHGYYQIAEQSVSAACLAKGIDPASALSGEEWISGPVIVLRNLRLLLQSLRDIRRSGIPRIDQSWIRHLPDGRLAIRVYPLNTLDSVLLMKHEAEVYLQSGVTEQNLGEHQAAFYQKPHDGNLCVVLGAGNVNSIPPTDVAHKMFVEGKVCILKMNPVNAYLGPFLERAFSPAIEKGFFAIVYGGAEEGTQLVNHPLVDEIHITGSDQTHDAIVWGAPGKEREERKRRNDPILKKQITSELGNITPVIVVPGPYREADLRFQGDSIAGMVANNASFNCNAAKLLVTQKDWKLRQPFLEAIERGLTKGVVRKSYYPGAEQRWKQFTEARRSVKLVGNAGPGELSFALISDVDPASDDRIFRQEPWCTVLSETNLRAADPVGFLQDAVNFVNDKVWGTLCAALVVHPDSQRDEQLANAVEAAIRDLKYGAVAINSWPAAVFALIPAPWGAHPSSTLQDIQSGTGWVHNVLMIEGIEKCVLRAPIKNFPASPWFPGYRTLNQLGRRLVDFEMNPTWLKVPGLATTAMRA
jgi:aldehyde dehydrogenase (NAD(P)+)